MVEPLIHFSVPFTALNLSGISQRRALLASVFALLPDLDVLAHVHRSESHSVPILAAIALPAILLTWGTKYRVYALLATGGLLSHVLLDLFAGYTPVLWPLYDQAVRLTIYSMIRFGSSPAMRLSAQILTEPVKFEPRVLDASLLTGEGLVISVVLVAPVLLRNLTDSFHHRSQH